MLIFLWVPSIPICGISPSFLMSLSSLPLTMFPYSAFPFLSFPCSLQWSNSGFCVCCTLVSMYYCQCGSQSTSSTSSYMLSVTVLLNAQNSPSLLSSLTCTFPPVFSFPFLFFPFSFLFFSCDQNIIIALETVRL